MYHVYVLKSDEYDRIYIGMTKNVDTRIIQHNSGKTQSTKAYIPWRLIYQEEYQSKRNALRRERQMKKSGLVRKQLKSETYKAPSSNG